jgi:hypothetical protein
MCAQQTAVTQERATQHGTFCGGAVVRDGPGVGARPLLLAAPDAGSDAVVALLDPRAPPGTSAVAARLVAAGEHGMVMCLAAVPATASAAAVAVGYEDGTVVLYDVAMRQPMTTVTTREGPAAVVGGAGVDMQPVTALDFAPGWRAGGVAYVGTAGSDVMRVSEWTGAEAAMGGCDGGEGAAGRAPRAQLDHSEAATARIIDSTGDATSRPAKPVSLLGAALASAAAAEAKVNVAAQPGEFHSGAAAAGASSNDANAAVRFTPSSLDARHTPTVVGVLGSDAAMRKGGIATVRVRRDGAVVATGGWDARIRLFDAVHGTALGVLRHHRETVSAVAWNPHQLGMLATGSQDSRIALWQLYGDC